MKTQNMALLEINYKQYRKYKWMNNIKNRWLRRLAFFFEAIGSAFKVFSKPSNKHEFYE
ncbi:MAG: hypothetical protein ACFFCS_17220 [Candidatus Hodarchaeota archaeon]